MSWMIAGTMAGAGLLSGYMNAKAQQAANKQQTNMAAAQAEFSPWTNIKPMTPDIKPADTVGGSLAGGMQGGLAGLMYNQANASKKPTLTPEASAVAQDKDTFDFDMKKRLSQTA